MFPIVELPEIVKHYAGWFEPVFSEEAWRQFQRYISGLIVSENKTIDGINRLIVHENRNQSSLNRLLTAGFYSEKRLNHLPDENDQRAMDQTGNTIFYIGIFRRCSVLLSRWEKALHPFKQTG